MKSFAMRKAHLVSVLFLSISLLVSSANAAETMPSNLAAAGNFLVFSNSEVSTAPAGTVGDIGLSLIAANEITDFSQLADHSNAFSLSPSESDKINAADDAVSCPLSKAHNSCQTGQ